MQTYLLAVTSIAILSIILLPLHSQTQAQAKSSVEKTTAEYDRLKNCASDQHTPLNPSTYLTHFSCGHVTILDNGTVMRKFTMVIHEDIKIPVTLGNPETHTKPIMYQAWTFNGSIPGPTMRMTKGDIVSVNVINLPTNKFLHSLHMHSIHAGNIDGTMFNNESGAIKPGNNFTYTFTADPVGLWPYHCHQMPLILHLGKGLYGHMIIDPEFKDRRPQMTELNMVLNGYDLGLRPDTEVPRIPTNQEADQIMSGNESANEALPQERDNNIYSANGVAFYYDVHPIAVQLNQPYRLYLTNMLDFDFQNTFHLHGQVFQYYPSGTAMSPIFTNDIVSMAQGDRGILEFQFDKPGLYMIHSHFESQSGRGWEGLFKAADFNSETTLTKSTTINPMTNQVETHTSTTTNPIIPSMKENNN